MEKIDKKMVLHSEDKLSAPPQPLWMVFWFDRIQVNYRKNSYLFEFAAATAAVHLAMTVVRWFISWSFKCKLNKGGILCVN